MVTRDLTLGGKYKMQYVDDVLETYILLSNVAWVNLIKKFKKGSRGKKAMGR